MNPRRWYADRSHAVVVALLLLAGCINVFARTLPLGLDLFLSLGASFIFVGLALAWGVSMRHRLLPGRMRNRAVAAAGLMALWMLLRAYKYRVLAAGNTAMLLCWYGYYVCHLGIACLLFLTCLDLWERERGQVPAVRACVVSLAVCSSCILLSNNAHQLVFSFGGGVPKPDGPYTYGPLYFAVVALIYGQVVASILLLARLRHLPALTARSLGPLVALGVSGACAICFVHVLEPVGLHPPFNYPDLACLTLLLVWEWLVQARLIPSNSHYAELFGAMQTPLCITDADFCRVYETKAPIRATGEQLARAVDKPLALDRNTLLQGESLATGYAFWEVDIAFLNRINDELEQTRKELDDQNELLAARNELVAQQTRIEARDELMDNVVRSFAPQLHQMKDQVASLRAQGASSQELAQLYAKGTYVKRAMNLRLLAAEQQGIDSAELVLCLRDSVGALALQGIEGAVSSAGRGLLAADVAQGLYDGYERVVECAQDSLERILVHVDVGRSCLSLALEPATLEPRVAALGLPCQEADGALYVYVPGGGGAL